MNLRLQPSLEEFGAAFAHGKLTPIWCEVVADHDTPVSAFQKVASGRHSFLLESVEGGEVWGRYSFFGSDPAFVLTQREKDVILEGPPGERVTTNLLASDGPVKNLRRFLASFPPIVTPPELGRFHGGAVGYFSYETVRYLEDVHSPSGKGAPPVASFLIPQWYCIYDRLRSRITIVAIPIARTERGVPLWPTAAEAYTWASRTILEVAERLQKPLRKKVAKRKEGGGLQLDPFVPSDGDFVKSVQKAREYITAGDIIQVVLSRTRDGETSADPFDVYRALRLINPSPYMFFLRMGPETLVGSSPEALVRVEGNKVATRPIAGTRPRGSNLEEDARREKELLADPKERAEHVMLVDLARNDIGRVSVPGSVSVSSLMRVERFSHVMHIVSDVEGTLAPGRDALDALGSLFPAGTLSGAPKIRAMQIIAELEGRPRGVYGGAVGYVGFNGNADAAITIRTIAFKGDRFRIQAGAGIVYDSDPAAECLETEAKAAGMVEALRMASDGLDPT